MNRYPTDEELNQFISNIEKQELYAPKNLKNEILTKAFPKQTVQVLPKPKSNLETSAPATKVVSLNTKYTMLSYRLKIIAGMAAAVVALFIVPMTGGISTYRDKLSNIAQTTQTREHEQAEPEAARKAQMNSVLNDNTREASQKLNTWISNLGNLLENNNGGNS